MTKNAKTFATIAIGAVLVTIVIFVARDLFLRPARIVNCADGSHPTIDMRDFATQYWAYSAKLETNVADKVKVSTELDPKVLAQVSQGLQEAREFRKYVVAGYNSCAITQAQYAQFGARFHALDGLAQELDALLSKPALSQEEKTRVGSLVGQYGDLARSSDHNRCVGMFRQFASLMRKCIGFCCFLAGTSGTSWAQKTVHCTDGDHIQIDVRQIAIQYDASSFAATLSSLSVLGARLEVAPAKLQEAAVATQQWNEFVKGLAEFYWLTMELLSKIIGPFEGMEPGKD